MIRGFRHSRRGYVVQAYRGYGTATRTLALGRVVREERIGASDERHSRWRNALHMLQRLDADPLGHARLTVGAGTPAEADDEGFFHAWTSTPMSPTADEWRELPVELLEGAHGPGAQARVPVLIPPPTARFGVISDMDDTVLQSRVDNLLRALRLMLLENARTRLPFPGVAAFYRALRAGADGAECNPIFYVSSSPWNLFDVIEEFLEAQRIPTGPLLLRDWDLGRSLLRNRAHKLEIIREIFATYSGMPFVLVGDTTQEDPEIYAELVRSYPGRILAVYIRNVRLPDDRRSAIDALASEVNAAGSSLVLADDTLAAARHAALHGWIASTAVDDVAADKSADEGDRPGKRDAPGTPGDAHQPTTIVDPTLSEGEKREVKE